MLAVLQTAQPLIPPRRPLTVGGTRAGLAASDDVNVVEVARDVAAVGSQRDDPHDEKESESVRRGAEPVEPASYPRPPELLGLVLRIDLVSVGSRLLVAVIVLTHYGPGFLRRLLGWRRGGGNLPAALWMVAMLWRPEAATSGRDRDVAADPHDGQSLALSV